MLRSTSADGPFASILPAGQVVSGTGYYDQTCQPQTQYWYEVEAVDGQVPPDYSAPSNVASVTTTASIPAPAAPTVPVPGGQPITITRVYNSQQANVLGDFGYGWSLQATASALSLVTEPPTGPYGGTTAFRPGDLVYITVPGGGGQHAFQFWPDPVSYLPGAGYGSGADPYGQTYAGSTYAPQFVCVDGSNSTLTVSNASLSYDPDTRELYNSETYQLFDPATYKLTTADGTVYQISGANGAITNSTDPSQQATSYASNGITSGDVSVRFVRNLDDNTISSAQVYVNNVAVGSPILYGYTDGDLTSVEARDGTTTQYAYGDSSLPHYLTTVTDGRGVPVLNATYDQLGELATLTDAQGNAAPIATGGDDGSGDSQTVADLTPQQNTTQDIYDSEGNVIREIKSIKNDAGIVTGYQVTVHQYTYFTGDLTDEIGNIFPAEGAATPGFSNQNVIASQTDYQPFIVSALADPVNQQPDPATISRQVTFGVPEDSSDPTDNAAQGLPVSETDYLAGGATRVTTYGNYKFGKPQVTTVSIYAAGVSPETGGSRADLGHPIVHRR